MKTIRSGIRQLIQATWLRFVRSLGIPVMVISTFATSVGMLRGDDTSKLPQQSLEVLLALDAGLWGQESLDGEGDVLRVRIKQPNKERLKKLVQTFPSLRFAFLDGVDESLGPGDLKCFDSLSHLESLWFLSPLTDQWAEAISRFTKLQELHLTIRAGVTERGLAALANLKEIETLSLTIGYEKFSAVEDESGASVLRQFPNTKTLTLSGASASRQTLREVGQHRQLRTLRCESSRTKLSKEDYVPLAQLSHLEEAVLPAAAATSIASLVSLKRVHCFAGINDDELKHFAGLRNLEEVILHSNRLSDQSLIHLKDAAALKTLELRCPMLDGSGLAHLADCKQLRRLLLRQTNFQPQNVRHVTAFAALEYLDLGWTPMSKGENWQSLEKLKVLRHLKEVQVELREPDRLRLGEMLPGVLINYLE